MAALRLRPADLRGAAQLGFDAFGGVAALVEQLHATILRRALPLGPGPGDVARTRGITGLAYGSIRGVARGVAGGLDAALGLWPQAASDDAPVSPSREAALAVLNGVWGDHLQATGNPLAITMALRVGGRPLALERAHLARALPDARGRVVVMLHGLCMNDLQWSRHGHDHGEMLAREGDATVLRLHYNNGLHVSDNGAMFGALMRALVEQWPVPMRELVLVGHSMGGLVARSAIHQAAATGQAWLAKLRALVCLGTPHHGAALERGGRVVDALFGLSPYAAPFARLGQARSAGITDLRYGNLTRADWEGRGRHAQTQDDRVPTPLPPGLPVYLVAATTAAQPRGLRHALIGDGLVALASAWGEHRDPAHALRVPASHKLLVTSANHWDLLDRPEVADALRRWLVPSARPPLPARKTAEVSVQPD